MTRALHPSEKRSTINVSTLLGAESVATIQFAPLDPQANGGKIAPICCVPWRAGEWRLSRNDGYFFFVKYRLQPKRGPSWVSLSSRRI